MGVLLDTFRSGSTADAALQQVYGLDQEGLEREWRRYIGAPPMAEGSPVGTSTPLAPAIPTFEPYALSTPTPYTESPTPQATPTFTGVAEELTPVVQRDTHNGGCTGGLPFAGNAGSQELGVAALPLGVLVLAGVALGIRRRKW